MGCLESIHNQLFLLLAARNSEIPSMSPFTMSMAESNKPRWRRVLLKVSGEALAGDQAQNIDPKVCNPLFILSSIFITLLCCVLYLQPMILHCPIFS